MEQDQPMRNRRLDDAVSGGYPVVNERIASSGDGTHGHHHHHTRPSSSNGNRMARSTSSSESAAGYQQYLKLRTVAIGLLDQAIHLLQHVVDSDARLTTVSELVPGSTIGKHLRHLHDHFRILFESALSTEKNSVLNYDSRERNVPMESSHGVVLQEFIKLKQQYLEDGRSELNRNSKIFSHVFAESDDGDDHHHDEALQHIGQRGDISESAGSCSMGSFDHERKMDLVAITPFQVCLKTTFNRELWFACLHATHHFALIRVIVTGELKLDLPKEFGVAPSTLERSKI